MTPLAHHGGEQALAPLLLLLLSGGGVTLVVAIGRARLAAALARVTRRVRGSERPHDGGR